MRTFRKTSVKRAVREALCLLLVFCFLFYCEPFVLLAQAELAGAEQNPKAHYGGLEEFSCDRAGSLSGLAAESQSVGADRSPPVSYVRTVGRFIQTDPLGAFTSQGGNPYSFANNNPISGRDPTGTIGFLAALVFIGISGLIGGGISVALGGNFISGFVGGAVFGLGLVLTGVPLWTVTLKQLAAAGFAGAAAERIAENTLAAFRGEQLTTVGVGLDIFVSGAFGAALAPAGEVVFRSAARFLGRFAAKLFRRKSVPSSGASAETRALLAEDPLIDNNILVQLAAGDPAAVTFAARRRGLLSVTREIRDEFLVDRSIAEFTRVSIQYEIRILGSASATEVAALATSLGVTSSRRLVDLSLLAAARRHGVGLVTADRRLFSAALRSGLPDPQFRIFTGELSHRIAAINRARNLVRQFRAAENVNRFTGSGIGR